MFANDQGLMGFPPARTYEATASGAVMVSSSHASFTDLGFVDGRNCVMHRAYDVGDFRDKVSWYIRNPDRLAAIAVAGKEFVRGRYSHAQVASGSVQLNQNALGKHAILECMGRLARGQREE